MPAGMSSLATLVWIGAGDFAAVAVGMTLGDHSRILALRGFLGKDMILPRVTVCIVTYNHERYIHDCIMSVLAQAHDVSLEVLIGDDQSTDRTEEIARALAARFPDVIRYFRHENRLGPGGNYQFLIGRARGEYIAHLDGDDFWLPGKLTKQISVMDKDSGVSASYTNALCIDDDWGANRSIQ